MDPTKQHIQQLIGPEATEKLYRELGGSQVYFPKPTPTARRKASVMTGNHQTYLKNIPVPHIQCSECGTEQVAEFGPFLARYCTTCRHDFFIELCPVCHHMGPPSQALTPEDSPACCPWNGCPTPWASETVRA